MSLLERIVRCDEIAKAGPGSRHPCEEIVSVQHGLGGGRSYQVPEPWRGDIKRAPLLFVSSNPSIELLDDAPWSNSPVAEIANYYGRAKITDRFPCASLRYGGEISGPVPFWKSVHKIAEELYGGEIEAGRDYAMTEVVHCKSRKEYGVNGAMTKCVEKFFRDVLGESGAAVIVSLGTWAGQALQSVAPRTRHLIVLAHPNAWGNVEPGAPDKREQAKGAKKGGKLRRRRPKTIAEAKRIGDLSENQIMEITRALRAARNAIPPLSSL